MNQKPLTPIERMVDAACGVTPESLQLAADKRQLDRQRQQAIEDACNALVAWRQKPMNGQQGLCDAADKLIELGW